MKKGFVLRVLYKGFCTEGFVQRVLYSGFCTKGFVSIPTDECFTRRFHTIPCFPALRYIRIGQKIRINVQNTPPLLDTTPVADAQQLTARKR